MAYRMRSMPSKLLKPAIAATAGCMLFSTPILAQILPPAPKAALVEITQEPSLEIAVDDLAILRWTTTNPGGDDRDFSIVQDRYYNWPAGAERDGEVSY